MSTTFEHLPHHLTFEAMEFYLAQAKEATEMLVVYTDVQISSGEYELYLFRDIFDRQLGFADREDWNEARYTFIVPGLEYATWFWRRFFLGVSGLSGKDELDEALSFDAAAAHIDDLERTGRLRIYSAPSCLTMTALLLMDGFSPEPTAIIPFSEGESLRFVTVPPVYAQRISSIWFDLLQAVGADDSPLTLVSFSSVSEDILDEAIRLKRIAS